MKKDMSLYIHIPFCESKCYYCDFLSFENMNSYINDYVDALCKQIVILKSLLVGNSIRTIFIGGGTPSILDINHFTKLFETIQSNYTLNSDLEFTIECNPCNITKEKLVLFKKYGVNRISLGLQAWQDELLRVIGRAHTQEDFINVYNNLVEVGFDNISVDVMFSLPGQKLEMLEETLDSLTSLNINHISCYSLTVEHNTKISKFIDDGTITLPDEEADREMYHMICEKLKNKRLEHYEISNFAKPGYRSRHNLVYWDQKEYIGLGLGAHSYLNGERYHNTSDLKDYLTEAAVGEFNKHDIEVIGLEAQYEEFMFLGLRKIEGIIIKEFQEKFNVSIYSIYGEAISSLISDGLLVQKNGYLHLTKRGIDLSNVVFREFLI